MRNRAAVILILFFVLLLIILANNGSLGNLLTINSTPVFTGPTARPLVFATSVPGGGVIPTAYAPTAFMSSPPTISLDQSQQSSGSQVNVPSGVVAPSGQCVVPNGWVAYSIQSGETLAIIADRYGLTVQQLAQANCMDNPDLIYADQVIAVPATASQ